MTKDKIKEIRKWYKQTIDSMWWRNLRIVEMDLSPDVENRALNTALDYIPELINEVKRLKKLLKTKENTN